MFSKSFKKVLIPLLFATTSFGIYKSKNSFSFLNKEKIELEKKIIPEVMCEEVPLTGLPGKHFLLYRNKI
jgi:hypothetical protein